MRCLERPHQLYPRYFHTVQTSRGLTRNKPHLKFTEHLTQSTLRGVEVARNSSGSWLQHHFESGNSIRTVETLVAAVASRCRSSVFSTVDMFTFKLEWLIFLDENLFHFSINMDAVRHKKAPGLEAERTNNTKIFETLFWIFFPLNVSHNDVRRICPSD